MKSVRTLALIFFVSALPLLGMQSPANAESRHASPRIQACYDFIHPKLDDKRRALAESLNREDTALTFRRYDEKLNDIADFLPLSAETYAAIGTVIRDQNWQRIWQHRADIAQLEQTEAVQFYARLAQNGQMRYDVVGGQLDIDQGLLAVLWDRFGLVVALQAALAADATASDDKGSSHIRALMREVWHRQAFAAAEQALAPVELSQAQRLWANLFLQHGGIEIWNAIHETINTDDDTLRLGIADFYMASMGHDNAEIPSGPSDRILAEALSLVVDDLILGRGITEVWHWGHSQGLTVTPGAHGYLMDRLYARIGVSDAQTMRQQQPWNILWSPVDPRLDTILSNRPVPYYLIEADGVAVLAFTMDIFYLNLSGILNNDAVALQMIMDSHVQQIAAVIHAIFERLHASPDQTWAKNQGQALLNHLQEEASKDADATYFSQQHWDEVLQSAKKNFDFTFEPTDKNRRALAKRRDQGLIAGLYFDALEDWGQAQAGNDPKKQARYKAAILVAQLHAYATICAPQRQRFARHNTFHYLF